MVETERTRDTVSPPSAVNKTSFDVIVISRATSTQWSLSRPRTRCVLAVVQMPVIASASVPVSPHLAV